MQHNNWLVRVSDGKNFINSSIYKIWGCESKLSKSFLKDVKIGDKLWFITSKSQGKIIAVSSFERYEKRIIGPLINLSLTDDELGWFDRVDKKSDIEIYYTNLYNLYECDININLKARNSIIRYKEDKYEIDLYDEYKNIVKYSKICFKF